MYFENVMYFSSVEGMEVKSPEIFASCFIKDAHHNLEDCEISLK